MASILPNPPSDKLLHIQSSHEPLNKERGPSCCTDVTSFNASPAAAIEANACNHAIGRHSKNLSSKNDALEYTSRVLRGFSRFMLGATRLILKMYVVIWEAFNMHTSTTPCHPHRAHRWPINRYPRRPRAIRGSCSLADGIPWNGLVPAGTFSPGASLCALALSIPFPSFLRSTKIMIAHRCASVSTGLLVLIVIA